MKTLLIFAVIQSFHSCFHIFLGILNIWLSYNHLYRVSYVFIGSFVVKFSSWGHYTDMYSSPYKKFWRLFDLIAQA